MPFLRQLSDPSPDDAFARPFEPTSSEWDSPENPYNVDRHRERLPEYHTEPFNWNQHLSKPRPYAARQFQMETPGENSHRHLDQPTPPLGNASKEQTHEHASFGANTPHEHNRSHAHPDQFPSLATRIDALERRSTDMTQQTSKNAKKLKDHRKRSEDARQHEVSRFHQLQGKVASLEEASVALERKFQEFEDSRGMKQGRVAASKDGLLEPASSDDEAEGAVTPREAHRQRQNESLVEGPPEWYWEKGWGQENFRN